MRLKISIAAVLILGLILTAQAFAAEEWVSEKEWAELAGEFDNYPITILQVDTLYVIVILDKAAPDLNKPVAMDIRNDDGLPIMFFKIEKEELELKWINPVLLGQAQVI